MGIYAQVISYAEGVRLSSRLGRAISDVSGRDRVCIYYNMFMRVCASVWIEDACICILLYILAQRLEDYASELIIGERELLSADTSFAPLRC